MPERLVDVEKQGSNVLHTFPITITAPAAEEDAFKEKALEAAGNAKLVPNEELDSLNAKMHVSRGGQLTPYGDPHGVLAETKAGLGRVDSKDSLLGANQILRLLLGRQSWV